MIVEILSPFLPGVSKSRGWEVEELQLFFGMFEVLDWGVSFLYSCQNNKDQRYHQTPLGASGHFEDRLSRFCHWAPLSATECHQP
jgi:hypothetical protein